MKLTRLFYLLLALMVLACSPKQPNSPTAMALSQTAHQLILPWHQDFQMATESLYNHLERFCQNPSNQGELEASRAAWHEAMLAWQTVRVINFGPIQNDNLAWRIQFWPDSHNRIGRKVSELIAKDQTITQQTLAEGVVLVQGLSAIEYVLFDPQQAIPANFSNPRTCQFLTAASDNTRSVAEELLRRWQAEDGNYLGTFLTAGPNNPHFESDAAALGTLLSAAVSTLEFMKNKKIGEPFGGEPKNQRINPYKLELWRSHYSLQAMRTEAEAVAELINVAIIPILKANNQQQSIAPLSRHLEQLLQLLNRADPPLFQSLRNVESHQLWQEIWLELTATLAILKRDIPPQLNVQLGFNANDGD